MSDNGPCMVCKGSKAEHFDAEGNPITQHVYTVTGGDLKSHSQVAQEKAAITPPVTIAPPTYMGNAGLSVARLTEVLLARNLISTEDALYIAGFKPTPDPQLSGVKN